MNLTPREIIDLYKTEDNYKAAQVHPHSFVRGMLHRLNVVKSIPKWSTYCDEADQGPTRPVRTKSDASLLSKGTRKHYIEITLEVNGGTNYFYSRSVCEWVYMTGLTGLRKRG